MCLGSRKNKIKPLQSTLKFLAGLFDSVINLVGGNSNLSATIDDNNGVLQVSSNNHSKPKVLYIEGGEIPSNHRQLLSAKHLYNQYHNYKSFVSANFIGQKVYYEGVRVPFGLEDFVKLIENAYFYTQSGEVAKAVSIKWRIGGDFATIDYYIREPYTKNLVETFIEPQ